jgi:hypothetical protein
MSLFVDPLYNDGAVSAVMVIQAPGENPVVDFRLRLAGIDPNANGELVVYQNWKLLRTAAFPSPDRICDVYPTFSKGCLVFLVEISRGDILVAQDWRKLTPELAEQAKHEINRRSGGFR